MFLLVSLSKNESLGLPQKFSIKVFPLKFQYEEYFFLFIFLSGNKTKEIMLKIHSRLQSLQTKKNIRQTTKSK